MDKVLVRGLEINCCHGVNDFEKIQPQPFIFDADIYCDFSAAVNSDNISDAVNYAAVCKLIAAAATRKVYNLIETLAYACAYAVLENTITSKVVLTVYKPQAPMKVRFQTVGVTVEAERTRAFLSLGSSMGDRKGYLDSALEKLNTSPHICVKKVSSYYSTPPYGGVARNEFLNCAAEIETFLSPRALLNAVHRIEDECGRVREKRWADRTLDIDIIFFGGKTVSEEGLIIPHPEYFKRDFVLAPLKEIAPDFVCPVLKKPIKYITVQPPGT